MSGRDSSAEGGANFDAALVQHAIRQLLSGVGEDPTRDGLVETPERVARSFAELFSGLGEDPSKHLEKTFEVDADGLVIVKDIEFFSMCEHHLLPFFGTVSVAYLPAGGRVTGLSKLARCVEGFARRPQVQERLTRQVAEAVEAALAPRGVAVIIRAEHMCMTMRGVSKGGSETVTTHYSGELRETGRRQEVLELL
ncbi:GTP cyclohydrolase I FolE [Actinomyces minihominis]|uniref:GTP cyclohydrolase I FolE n=1 Tax=Actinomyces minihominis TaxID=2002838 RepID=UPI000C084DE5|nr:GTP cyclohydrolase I FolE [Actinomyces minihominis]